MGGKDLVYDGSVIHDVYYTLYLGSHFCVGSMSTSNFYYFELISVNLRFPRPR
jgi:hypothetical protein